MTKVTMVENESSTQVDTIEEFYPSPVDGNGTTILAFTATNNTETNQSFLAYIFDAEGNISQAVIPFTLVARDRFSSGTPAINHVIPKGGTLRMESSSIGAFNFYVTGDEL